MANKITFFYDKESAEKYVNDDLKLFAQDTKILKGNKNFFVESYENVYKYITASPKYWYEYVTDKPCKLFLDLDLHTSETHVDKISRMFNNMVNQAITLINTHIKLDKPSIIILRSNQTFNSDSNKLSAHVIYNNIWFNSVFELKSFFLNIKSLTDTTLLDKSVYKIGCFRMMHCSTLLPMKKKSTSSGIANCGRWTILLSSKMLH